MLKAGFNKENFFSGARKSESKPNYHATQDIDRIFSESPLSRDPSNIPSFNFVDPKICVQSYVIETSILDRVLPSMNPKIKSKSPPESKEKPKKQKNILRSSSQINKSKPVQQNDSLCSPMKKSQKLVRFQGNNSPCMILNGIPVSIKKEKIFEEGDFKKSGFLDVSQGMKLSDFQLGKPLGKGRFGSVFLCKHKLTNAIFAIKMVNKQLAKDENVFHLIQREAAIQESLDHPNILKCFGSFEDDTRFYLILEYVTDGDLYSTMRKQHNKRFSEETASQILYQILKAVKYLKKKHILHRDIKAENIMNCMGILKLSDFGWSIFNQENNERKTFCGTIEYVAPEMIMDQGYNESIDMWAIAVLAFELVHGEPPFNCADSIETFSKILDVSFVMPEFFSEELKDFLGKILIKDVGKRMQVTDALLHAFIQKHNRKGSKGMFCL